jgi:hypothetical protein
MKTALDRARQLEAEFTNRPKQLSLWDDRVRGMSKSLVNSALFAVLDKRKPRRNLENEVVQSLQDVEIRYTGKQLDQDDHLVFMQLCHHARTSPFGEVVKVTGLNAINGLGWDRSCLSYERLRASYRRLLEGTVYVEITGQKRRKVYGSHLISKLLEEGHHDDDVRGEFTIVLDPSLANILTGDEMTLLDWARHFKLSGLAKWLHAFYSTHKVPLPYKAETLLGLCGSKQKNPRLFRAKLKDALDELVPEFLDSYTIGPRPSYLVTVKKKRDAKVIEAA